MIRTGFLSAALVGGFATPALADERPEKSDTAAEEYEAQAETRQEGPPPGGQGGPPGGRPPSVFDGDWVTVGVGVGVGSSYSGSDDYRISPAPVLQGSIGGIRLAPRPAGLAADFIPDGEGRITYSFGPSFRVRSDRADDIEDEVVELAGELDRAFELGFSSGIGISQVFGRADNLGFELDVRWDVAGAHSGRVIEPQIAYFTPINRGMIGIFNLSAQFVDDDFADYYYSVDAAQSAATGLAPFQAEGGLNSIGANALLIIDLDGNLANGGLSAVVIGGYSRLQGDAADTPYTSVRGDANQLFGALGIAYTF
ncbi:MipA/OmpV family protein [Altererythrobacter lutimaris]|uniref:MipA/OmpV family protein n=1 Tax=Altererythrobacter lutimaris TaxID=2743979 RepID=A0A850H9D3_9SPHN|nr:MipA/OmpV family protein [Altererythrobacter lutimaris]NVE95924.1 MipA/OmpV family protein [Altererythrobacter lutimaris]